MAIPTRPADGGYYDPNAPVEPAPLPGATPGGGGGRGGLWEYLKSILDPTQLAGLEPFFGGRGGGGGFGNAAAQDAYLERARARPAGILDPDVTRSAGGGVTDWGVPSQSRFFTGGVAVPRVTREMRMAANTAAAAPSVPAPPPGAPVLPAGTLGEVTAHGYPLLASMLSGGGLQSAFARRANQDAGGGMGGTAAAPAAAAAVAPAAPRVAPTSFGSYLARLGRR